MDFCISRNNDSTYDIEIVATQPLDVPLENFRGYSLIAKTSNLKPFVMLALNSSTGDQVCNVTFRDEEQLLGTIDDVRATQRAYQILGNRQRIKNRLEKESQRISLTLTQQK